LLAYNFSNAIMSQTAARLGDYRGSPNPEALAGLAGNRRDRPERGFVVVHSATRDAQKGERMALRCGLYLALQGYLHPQLPFAPPPELRAISAANSSGAGTLFNSPKVCTNSGLQQQPYPLTTAPALIVRDAECWRRQ